MVRCCVQVVFCTLKPVTLSFALMTNPHLVAAATWAALKPFYLVVALLAVIGRALHGLITWRPTLPNWQKAATLVD